MSTDAQGDAGTQQIVTGLVRTTHGNVVHRNTCRLIAGAHYLPWGWSEGRKVTEVRPALAMTNSVTCLVCDPLS